MSYFVIGFIFAFIVLVIAATAITIYSKQILEDAGFGTLGFLLLLSAIGAVITIFVWPILIPIGIGVMLGKLLKKKVSK